MKSKLTVIIFCLCMISSCTQIAKESLTGLYKGEVIYFFHLSQLNLGLEDKQETQKCTIQITKTDKKAIISCPDGEIYISGIKLLQNGSFFNIPEQEITSSSNVTVPIIGNSIFQDTDGFKMDGGIDDTNTLGFSFTGTVKQRDENGNEFDIPFSAVYKVKKQE